MDEKKKFEINDEMLESVSGGADSWLRSEYRVGETFKVYCPSGCGGRKGSTVVITEIIDERLVKVKMNCCGREFVIEK